MVTTGSSCLKWWYKIVLFVGPGVYEKYRNINGKIKTKDINYDTSILLPHKDLWNCRLLMPFLKEWKEEGISVTCAHSHPETSII